MPVGGSAEVTAKYRPITGGKRYFRISRVTRGGLWTGCEIFRG
jgi:hypothetical protein